MTSRRHWSILVALLLMLSLFLVACVRPLPGDNEAVTTMTPAETDSSSQPETYPGPSEIDEEDTSTGYPADETYPAGEESAVSNADLLQPANESETNAEGYPATEGEAVEEGEVIEGEATEGGETAEGEAAEDEATEEGDAAEGETAEGEANKEGETAEGEAAEEGDAAEGEAAEEGDAAEGETAEEGDAAEGETTEGEATEEGDAAEGEAAESSEETPVVESGRTHTVSPGENLFRIGMQYGMSWVTLAQANGLTNPNSLSVGQVLTIPDDEAADTTETSDSSETSVTGDTTEDAEATGTAGAEEADSVEAASEETIYVVQSGDNLYRISLQFGVSMMEIARENGLADFNQVYVGQELIIPYGDETAGTAEEVTHLVQENETVFGIAFQYGIAWTKLVEANEIPSPYTLEVGETLIIPSGE